jgi:hypothetical protein
VPVRSVCGINTSTTPHKRRVRLGLDIANQHASGSCQPVPGLLCRPILSHTTASAHRATRWSVGTVSVTTCTSDWTPPINTQPLMHRFMSVRAWRALPTNTESHNCICPLCHEGPCGWPSTGPGVGSLYRMGVATHVLLVARFRAKSINNCTVRSKSIAQAVWSSFFCMAARGQLRRGRHSSPTSTRRLRGYVITFAPERQYDWLQGCRWLVCRCGDG